MPLLREIHRSSETLTLLTGVYRVMGKKNPRDLQVMTEVPPRGGSGGLLGCWAWGSWRYSFR